MRDKPNSQIPEWFLPQVQDIYLSLRMMAVTHKRIIDLHVGEAELQASLWKGLSDALEGPVPSLENLKAAIEEQHEILRNRADAIKKLPIQSTRIIDQIDVSLERAGIKIPPEMMG